MRCRPEPALSSDALWAFPRLGEGRPAAGRGGEQSRGAHAKAAPLRRVDGLRRARGGAEDLCRAGGGEVSLEGSVWEVGLVRTTMVASTEDAGGRGGWSSLRRTRIGGGGCGARDKQAGARGLTGAARVPGAVHGERRRGRGARAGDGRGPGAGDGRGQRAASGCAYAGRRRGERASAAGPAARQSSAGPAARAARSGLTR